MVKSIEEYYGLFKDRLVSQGIEGICVDVDDTVAATNLFWAKHHLQEYGGLEDLSAEDIIRKYRYVSSVPYWASNHEAENWITQNCASVHGRSDVVTVDGAKEGMLNIEGEVVAYLTGRSQDVNEGTGSWLQKKGFPEREVLARPSDDILNRMNILDTHEWKARFLEFMFPQISGIVDDNEGLISALSPSYEGTVFLYSHTKITDVPCSVIVCPTWDEVVHHVNRTRELEHLRSAYDDVANDFHTARTQKNEMSGFGHREIEQPNMFRIVPDDLSRLRMLELGCGPGIHASEYMKRGAELDGIDLSPEMVKLARASCPKGNFKVGNAYEIPYDNNSFDLVTSSLLLDHIEDLDVVFQEVNRVLKPGGNFFFSVPHPMLNIVDSVEELRVTNSYFSSSPRYFSVANNPTKIKAHRHQLAEYFKAPMRSGFILCDFIESQPDSSWVNDYEGLDAHYMMMPELCLFHWEKALS